jgi:His-Xaa-Ser system radical SAM maturase HxsC
MIPLRGRARYVDADEPLDRSVWRLVDRESALGQRVGRAFLVENDERPPDGFGLYLARNGANGASAPAIPGPTIGLPALLDHLEAGDVVSLSNAGQDIRVLWRHESLQNSILLTERCNHYCLMCSQPPKEVDDDHLMDKAFELIRLLPRTTPSILFTGGEPTLYGQRLVDLLKLTRNLLPFAGVHVLSNGRRFADPEFSAAWASIANPNLMVGIPIYGAEASLHDYVVQADGAFDETLQGLLQLGGHHQRIEIRVVLHKQTAPYLTEIAEFIARNLPFVEQVALMGLEMIGFARANMDELWIDPIDYKDELAEAVALLDRRRVRTMIYNTPLCLIDRELWPFAVKSISDWKNEWHPECEQCSVREQCGGFFYSAKYRVSDHIQAIPPAGGRQEKATLALAE